MPLTYAGNGNYRIECNGPSCTNHVVVAGRWQRENADAADVTTGLPVSDMFRWERTARRYFRLCRSCEREYNRNWRASRSGRTSRAPRVPGTPNPNRKFGVEFECYVPRSVTREAIQARLLSEGVSGWRIKGDGSLSSGGGIQGMGIEVVSPPLSGDAGIAAMTTVLRVLREMGAVVDRTCGTHVHHDAADLAVDDMKRVVSGWHRNQPIIDGLVSLSRRSSQAPTYCRPLAHDDVRRVERCTTLQEMKHLSISRYRTLNLAAYGKYGTIEIRQHQGTLNAEKVRTWIRLGQAIIDTARVSEIPATSRVRDFMGVLGDRIDETARTFTLGRAVEFGAVTV